MRRPHRSIETFDISLMAVVTKAMGAFLVLMLLLLPYYTPNKKAKETAAQLVEQLQDIRDTIDRVSRQLGEPDNSSPDMEKSLKVAVDEVSLSLEVVAKLEGLLNKALSDLARLEKENRELKSESETQSKSQDDLEKARREIEELRSEIRQLKDKLNNTDRTLIASFVSEGCTDVIFDGMIVSIGAEGKFTWTKDKKPIPAAEVPFINITNGGDIVRNFPKDEVKLGTQDVFENFRGVRNSIVLRKGDVGIGRYAIMLLKKTTNTWNLEDRSYRFLTRSKFPCRVLMSATSGIGGSWQSIRPKQFQFAAEVVGGITVVADSTSEGIEFKPPTKQDEKWFADWMVKAKALQGEAFKKKAQEILQKSRGGGKKTDKTNKKDKTKE